MTFRSRLVAAGCGVVCVSVLTAAALAMAAPASPAPPADSGRVCFHTRDVNGISVSSPIGPKKLDGVYLRMNNHDVFQLSLTTICTEDLQDSVRLGIEATNVGGTICQGTDAHIIAQSKLTGQRRECWGSELRKLGPDDLAAIPAKERP
jgi:hypothetical protein